MCHPPLTQMCSWGPLTIRVKCESTRRHKSLRNLWEPSFEALFITVVIKYWTASSFHI